MVAITATIIAAGNEVSVAMTGNLDTTSEEAAMENYGLTMESP
jgi:hypothetical protein